MPEDTWIYILVPVLLTWGTFKIDKILNKRYR